ncbi:MAG: anti-sigma factor family protein [Gemmatimonadales bacterium]
MKDTAEPSRLSCGEAFLRLDDYVDRELSAPEQALVEGHLEVCARCAAEFAFEAQVLQDLKDKLRRLEAPPTLRARIKRALSHPGEGMA